MKRILSAVFSLCCLCGIAQRNISDSLINQADVFAQKNTANYQPAKAFAIYQASASMGNVKAMNALGVCYTQAIGVAYNRQNAINWFVRAANAGYVKSWYNLAMVYKDVRHFDTAYACLAKGAALHDEQSIYAMGYMQYKGLGCTQDYAAAIQKFARGLKLGMTNSMYYYGLCLRNGYGVSINMDSARYWLTQSANLDNKMADYELTTAEPEHVNSNAGVLVQKIKAAMAVMPQTNAVNQYIKVEHRVDVNEIGGTYTGYLLKYDWSGQNIIEANKLIITLNYNGDSLSGTWAEDDSLTVPIHALLSPRGLVFKQMQYSKTNHNSLNRQELTVFKKANLQLDKIGDSVYLSGNINQFIPKRNEPTKPLYVALVRSKVSTGSLTYITEQPLRAYPNPFGSNITVDFDLKEPCNVTTQLLTMDGKVVYNNPAGTLAAGSYTLPLQTQQIAAGYYTLVLRYGNKIRTAKVMKL